jgi:hypothetical protein
MDGEERQMLYCADQGVTIASYSIVAVKSDSGHNERITEPRTLYHHADAIMQMQPEVFN